MSNGKPPVLLIFGEDDNDLEAIQHLLLALSPEMPKIEKHRRPLILMKGREAAKARKNAIDVARVVNADRKRFDVRMVFAHQDCDAVEPAHEVLSDRIEQQLESQGVTAIAVTPAWEMEAWWFLWPDAVTAVNGKWRRPTPRGKRVGLIPHAKEALRRAVRPRSRGKPVRDYEESDSPRIAQKVRELELIDTPEAVSLSFERFRQRVREAGFR